ncbi:MAG TPA: hypothetical protein PLI09_00585 [Candidatus Hydrogenedentes bacterium]|nr:hypothetical protein [Candidatus Hydrogenedentota bacterium]
MDTTSSRRRFIQNTLGLSAMAALGAGKVLAKEEGALPEAAPDLSINTGTLPQGKIGNLSISRFVLGGNLITHYTHSRDLMYVYKLAEHYNTHERVQDTLLQAERNGINTVSIHTVPQLELMIKHHRERGGKLQWIVCCTAKPEDQWDDYVKQVDMLIRLKVSAIYLFGVAADRLVKDGRMDLVAKCVELVKERGLPSGVGGHDLRVIQECEKNKIPADFYIKTFHHHNYPSAPRPDELTEPTREVPGYWCLNPQETIDFMKTVEKPWFAFKVMAAGAIPPRDAFTYAFNNGADHVLAGMFDFEMDEDVKIAREVLADVKRERPWRS